MRIATILNILDEEYQISIYDGIKQNALKKGIELLCIQQEHARFQKNTLTTLLPNKDFFDVDGIIFLTSVFSESELTTTMQTFESYWGKKPFISIGEAIPGIHSVSIRTRKTMEFLMRHLIKEHSYKSFLFLSGLDGHQDNKDRLDVFIKTIENFNNSGYNLTYQVIKGEFTEVSASRVLSAYISEHEEEPVDAIVCANDNMALGVSKLLKTRQINSKWSNCAVTGFDDIPQAELEIPAFTTVHQPLVEMGAKAIDLIVQLVNGNILPEMTFIDSSLVIRQSCGCKPENKSENHYSNEKINQIQHKFLQSEQFLRRMTHMGQQLNYCTEKDGLIDTLEANLTFLDVEDFMLFTFDNIIPPRTPLEKSDLNVTLVYQRKNGKQISPRDPFPKGKLQDFCKTLAETPCRSYIVKHLYENARLVGFIIYDAPSEVHPYVVSISINIAQTIYRLHRQAEHRKYSEQLEKEVNERTKELVKANDKRIQVEAEVLKISELERQRFSTDLHDDICQRLAGIAMLCRSYSNTDEKITKAQMTELTELITDTLQTTRQYAHNSFPVELNTLGMKDSIENLCASVQSQSKIKCNYSWHISDKFEFDPIQRLNIFRIIQEALHNVAKHSRATQANVHLEESKKYILIQISDNGIGMESNDTQKGGMGLHSMQYRADQINLHFTIKPNKPQGTIIELKLPKFEKAD